MENRSNFPFHGGPIRPTAVAVDGSTMHPTFSQTRPVARGFGLSAVPRALPTVIPTAPSPSPSKRACKDRGPNWVPQEIMALIAAKQEQYLQALDTVDGRDLMAPETSKWIRIAHCVNCAGFSPFPRDGLACKAKWNQLMPNYKRIANYFSRTGRNLLDYWDLSPTNRKNEGLPRVFAQDVYYAIHEWYGQRPMIQPPHVRDMLAPNDDNYRQTQEPSQHKVDDCELDTEDPMDYVPPDNVQGPEETTPPRSPRQTSSTPSCATGPSNATETPNAKPYNGFPPGITPHYISSSETSHFGMQRRPGNTVVKRKNVTGHAIIIEATKATGAIMAQQMQNMVDASRELERSKIEVQLKIFGEQMVYQRKKDRRLYENSQIANDNARLSILKQAEMVSCLAQLSAVLSNSFSMNKDFIYPPVPTSAIRDHNITAATVSAPRHQTVTPPHSPCHANFDFNFSGHPNFGNASATTYPTTSTASPNGTTYPTTSTASPSGLSAGVTNSKEHANITPVSCTKRGTEPTTTGTTTATTKETTL